jgi:hypothetical protein
MPAILNDGQARFWYHGGHLFMDIEWRESILAAANDKGGAFYCWKIVSAVWPSYDGVLVTHEYFRAYTLVHLLNMVTKLFVLHSVGVNDKG